MPGWRQTRSLARPRWKSGAVRHGRRCGITPVRALDAVCRCATSRSARAPRPPTDHDHLQTATPELRPPRGLQLCGGRHRSEMMRSTSDPNAADDWRARLFRNVGVDIRPERLGQGHRGRTAVDACRRDPSCRRAASANHDDTFCASASADRVCCSELRFERDGDFPRTCGIMLLHTVGINRAGRTPRCTPASKPSTSSNNDFMRSSNNDFTRRHLAALANGGNLDPN